MSAVLWFLSAIFLGIGVAGYAADPTPVSAGILAFIAACFFINGAMFVLGNKK